MAAVTLVRTILAGARGRRAKHAAVHANVTQWAGVAGAALGAPAECAAPAAARAAPGWPGVVVRASRTRPTGAARRAQAAHAVRGTGCRCARDSEQVEALLVTACAINQYKKAHSER